MWEQTKSHHHTRNVWRPLIHYLGLLYHHSPLYVGWHFFVAPGPQMSKHSPAQTTLNPHLYSISPCRNTCKMKYTSIWSDGIGGVGRRFAWHPVVRTPCVQLLEARMLERGNGSGTPGLWRHDNLLDGGGGSVLGRGRRTHRDSTATCARCTRPETLCLTVAVAVAVDDLAAATAAAAAAAYSSALPRGCRTWVRKNNTRVCIRNVDTATKINNNNEKYWN